MIAAIRIASLLLVAATATSLFPAEDGAPPTFLDRTPFRPSYVSHLDDAAFMKRMKGALARVNRERLKLTPPPARGVVIISVSPDGPAAQVGLKPGDVIVSVDGEPVWNWDALLVQRARNVEQTLGWITETGETRTSLFPPGYFYGRLVSYWAGENLYAAEGPRDPRWDDLMLAAGSHCSRDPEFAESALVRALDAGFPPGGVADRLGVRILLNQCRYDEALRLGWHVLQANPKDAVVAADCATAALRSGDIPMALAIFEQNPSIPRNDLPGLRVLASATKPPDLAARAAERFRDPLFLRTEALTEREYAVGELNKIVETGQARYSAGSGRFYSMVFGPECSDVELTCRFSFKDTDNQPSFYAKIIAIGFLNLDHPRADDTKNDGMYRGFYGLCFSNPSTVQLLHEHAAIGSSFEVEDVFKEEKRERSLRIILLDGWCETWIDGRLLFRAPMPKDARRFAPAIKTVGSTINIRALKIHQLVDRKDAAASLVVEKDGTFRNGWTRLHRAIFERDIALLDQVLASGANINIADTAGRTPLHLAWQLGWMEAVEVLRARGANEDAYTLAAAGKPEPLAALLKGRAHLARDFTPVWTPLHAAAEYGTAATAVLIVDSGADINAKSGKEKGQRPALIIAVERGDLALVEALIEKKAEVNLADGRGWTALKAAQSKKLKEIEALLLKHNATTKAVEAPPVRPPEPPSNDKF